MRLATSAALAVGIAVLLLTGNPAWAWEADVHYGLTKWLALQVGYSEQHAEWIAEGNQGVDKSWETGPIVGTILGSCMGPLNELDRSLSVHDSHFPSMIGPPKKPDERKVVGGKVWMKGQPRKPPSLNGRQADFLELGKYLHALQDSWSHQGEPDVPSICNPEWGFGHAIKRGGWSCHLADLSYRWQETDIPSMAKATYEVLLAAQKKNMTTVEFERLTNKIYAFAGTRTKWEKDEWFSKENFSNRDFLQRLSLPDCAPDKPLCTPYPFQQLLERGKQIIANKKPTDTGVNDEDIFKKFFDAMVENKLSTLSELIDEASAAAALVRALHVQDPCPELYLTLFPFLLGEGFISGRGAHQPIALCELATQLLPNGATKISCKDAVNAAREAIKSSTPRGPGLKELSGKIDPPYVNYSIYHLPPHRKIEGHFALASFLHLPRTVLYVGMEEGTKITSFIWLPSEE